MEQNATSIIEMARGAFIERTDYEMARVIENILDPNTNPTAKRKITLTLELIPNSERTNISVNVTVKSALAATSAVTTMLYVAGSNSTGEMQVVEMVPQVPGQMSLGGEEQTAPAMLKLVQNA